MNDNYTENTSTFAQNDENEMKRVTVQVRKKDVQLIQRLASLLRNEDNQNKEEKSDIQAIIQYAKKLKKGN